MSSGKFLEMDRETIRNLELVENEKEKNNTLYSIFNFCNTAKGKDYSNKEYYFQNVIQLFFILVGKNKMFF
ncbi:hypothetical protein LEP1GSC170_1659 [Leptospira interrogans serovar Bataviae str. HAI135]|nr:hypothetical protein LEP1GSC170_1659 [Leptospira interrogans serovar Bataviae str. HAI135]